MVIRESRPFAYGRFAPPLEDALAAPPLFPSVAIEILREFSTSELIGKVYTKGPVGAWVPVTPSALKDYDWYKQYKEGDGQVLFDMEPSGRWNVLNFRIESDERGPYVAVALRYASPQ